MKTVFLRALEADDKAATLGTAIHEPEAAQGKQRFEVDAASFAAVPGSPFAYWVSDGLRRLFKELLPFEAEGRTVKQGLATADDFRFLRCAWEIGENNTWLPVSKGGTPRGFYTDYWLQIAWYNEGHELASFADSKTGKQRSAVRNPQYYGTPGFTYTLRAARFSPQVMPAGVIITTRGSGIYLDTPGRSQYVVAEGLAYLALLNSTVFDGLIKMMLGRGGHPQFDMGDIAITPTPRIADASAGLAEYARRAWSLRRGLDTQTETSHAFTLPAVLQADGCTLAARAGAWAKRVRGVDAELADIQAEIDERCFELYGINEADRRAITEGFRSAAEMSDGADTQASIEADGEGEREDSVEAVTLVADLASWAVGVAFGRFDVRLATGVRPLPEEPEPFDALPVCAPAMLTGDDGLPLTGAPADYPVDFPENGILVGDPGHSRDLTAAVQAVFEVVFGDRADAILQEATALLDPRGHDLRAWLASDFFDHHLKRYSKSRRKAPILWQLGVPSGRFSVWLYAHRLARDSFFQIRRDVVEPKLIYEERQLTDLVEDAGARPSAKQRREIAAQEAFIEELRIMLDEVKRVAPEWNPTLDDGVVLTMAPLSRLVPQHKAWQRELKSKWEELADGRYDWAHIAMRHWPGRVTAKCATDPSLAIAHGLSR